MRQKCREPRSAELEPRVSSLNEVASKLPILPSRVFPNKVTTIKNVELVLGQRFLQTLRVGKWNEWVVATDGNLAGHFNLRETIGQSRKRIWVIANKCHRLKKARPG